MVGWSHQLNGHKCVQGSGVGDGQSLFCIAVHVVTNSWTLRPMKTERLKMNMIPVLLYFKGKSILSIFSTLGMNLFKQMIDIFTEDSRVWTLIFLYQSMPLRNRLKKILHRFYYIFYQKVRNIWISLFSSLLFNSHYGFNEIVRQEEEIKGIQIEKR